MQAIPSRTLGIAAVLTTLTGALLVAFGLPGCGSDDTAPVTVSPERYDFGRVLHRVTEHKTFTITNHSDRSVTLTLAKPNCSCFTVSRTPRPRLDPGESTEMEIEFATWKRPPERLRGKHLQIRTDHPDAPLITVPLEGTIYSPFFTEPRDSVQFGLITGEAANYEPRQIKIRAEPGYKVRLAKGLPNYDDGYNISHPQVFDVVAKDVADGVDLFVSIKKGAPAPSGTLTPALNVMLDVDGPEIGEEPIPKAFRLDLTWPHGDAPPGPVGNANHGR